MTEFKKVVQLCDTVAAEATRIAVVGAQDDYIDSEDAPWLQWYESFLQSAVDLARRCHKLLLKANEADPIKQIYNELMCERIRELWERVLKTLQDAGLGEDVLVSLRTVSVVDCNVERMLMDDLGQSPSLVACYKKHESQALRRMASAQWMEHQQRSISGLQEQENACRVGVEVEWRSAASLLWNEVDISRRAARAREEFRESERWRLEQERRASERQREVLDVRDLRGMFPATPDRHWQVLIQRLLDLASAIVRNPEEAGIRTIRYTPVAVEHFGHPCIWASLDNEGSGDCSCASMNTTAERVMALYGYVPRYTTSANYNATVMRWFDQPAEGTPAPPTLVCGLPLSQHKYHPMGFEPYGERTMQLCEPNAMNENELDAWCVWHQRVSDAEMLLRTTVGTFKTR